MDTEKYLQQILKGQELSDDQEKALESSREEVEELLRAAFRDSHPAIRYAGSKIKGTMNQISFDLDIICYFNQDDASAGESLEDIYNNVKDFLSESYVVEEKTSALRIKSKEEATYGVDFHIDVVPGRFVDDKKKDTFLYQSSGEKKRLKTNLDMHIKHITDSGLVDVIRLAKIWREKLGLEVKTFVLELLVVKYAKKSKENHLSVGIKSFWEALNNQTDSLSIEDPANPEGNDLSSFLDECRSMLGEYAGRALQNIEQDDWKSIFGEPELESEEKMKEINVIASSTPNAPRPWAYGNENMASK